MKLPSFRKRQQAGYLRNAAQQTLLAVKGKEKRVCFFILALGWVGTLPIWVNGVSTNSVLGAPWDRFFNFDIAYGIIEGSGAGFFFFIPAGIWWVIESFYLENRLKVYNAPIFSKIREIEAEEKEAEQARNAMIAEAIKSAGKADGDKNKGVQ